MNFSKIIISLVASALVGSSVALAAPESQTPPPPPHQHQHQHQPQPPQQTKMHKSNAIMQHDM
jgi:Spy/CpxP family protein refolding chaperone